MRRNLFAIISSVLSVLLVGSVIAFADLADGPPAALVVTVARLLGKSCVPAWTLGMVGDGVTPNDTPFNNWLTAIGNNYATSTGGCLYFGRGKYRFNTNIAYTLPNRMFSVSIHGAGQDATILYWPNASGGMAFTWGNFENSFHISDLSITTSQGGGGVGLGLYSTIAASGYQQATQNDVTRVTVQGDTGTNSSAYWTTGILAQAISYVNFDSILIYGGAQTGTGLYLSDYSGVITANFNINRSSFLDLNYGLETNNDPQGVAIVNSTFVDDNYGIISSGSNALEGMSISNSNFGCIINGALIYNTVNDLLITGTLFINNDATNTYSPLELASANRVVVVGNDFWTTKSTTQAHILGISVTGGIITGNIFTGSTYGIYLESGTSYINVQSNSYSSGISTQVGNAGSNNTVGGGSK